jgi:hypothetical protein
MTCDDASPRGRAMSIVTWLFARRHVAVLALGALAARPPTAAHSQQADARRPPLDVGLRVDTLGSPRREILRLWRAYLDARPHTYEPKPQWSPSEQRRWPIFDLAMPMVYQSESEFARTRAIVVEIEPAKPGDTTEYVVRTLFTRTDSAIGRELPVALIRVYAVREGGTWVLSNAVTRLTKDWRRTRVPPITFIYPPGHRLDTARARRSVRFIDSLVHTFGAPRPRAVTYYLARSPEEALRISGVELAPPGTTARSVPANYMVFSGLPQQGEFYPHELTHLIVGWVLPELGAPPVLDEGMAFWLGGSRGKSWRTLLRELASALHADPALTAERLLARPPTDSLRPTAAGALLHMAHERGGMRTLRAALSTPRGPTGPDVMRGVEHALGLTRAEVEAAWRAFVVRAGRR